jgi:hypothetical protein
MDAVFIGAMVAFVLLGWWLVIGCASLEGAK